eukprot:6282021-Pyramimonas_sp.AAC.2
MTVMDQNLRAAVEERVQVGGALLVEDAAEELPYYLDNILEHNYTHLGNAWHVKVGNNNTNTNTKKKKKKKNVADVAIELTRQGVVGPIA